MTAPLEAPRVSALGDCPLPKSRYDHVLLGHGSGGRLTAELIQHVFLPAFDNEVLAALEDQAILDFRLQISDCRLNGRADITHKSSACRSSITTLQSAIPRLAFTTDSFVVRPLFFPGGDIGSLAVHGTVNDLAVGGAIPRYLLAAFILEEGLPLSDLTRIVASMQSACVAVGVGLVTGDTKVVDRGKGDGVFITTTGIGTVAVGRRLSIRNARPGDCILVSGTLGDHGIAILSVREGLEFETVLESDTAPLHPLTEAMLAACPETRCMRDPTRGGLSSALNELAAASGVGIVGLIAREQQAIVGEVEVSATHLNDDLFRFRVVARNKTPLKSPANRDEALMHSLVSTHILLGVESGEFMSMFDPPEDLRDAADACRNVGVWPVLVGAEGDATRCCPRPSSFTTTRKSPRKALATSLMEPRSTKPYRFE